MFYGRILHSYKFKSELKLAKFGFSTAKHSKIRFVWWNIAFVRFKLRTVSEIGFFTVKHWKRRVLLWNIIIMQVKVKVGTCTKQIFYGKIHKKRCFVVGYRICAIYSQSWHLQKSEFLLQNTQKDVFCGGILHLCNLKSELTIAKTRFFIVKHSKRRVLWLRTAFVQPGTWTKLILYSKMHKKTCFAVKYRICAISSQNWYLHKSDFHYKTPKKMYFVLEYSICTI